MHIPNNTNARTAVKMVTNSNRDGNVLNDHIGHYYQFTI